MKQTDIDKNEEEKRIKEYNKIFNLLNSNIEQFKKMFINNMDNIHKDKNKKIIIKNVLKTIIMMLLKILKLKKIMKIMKLK